ncbi:AbrB/MazE/SpoVT family DNA-binding domain-containing protein [Aerococcus viridans]|uniref:Addiction module antidote n=3 Tax=Aerococcus viridans TaxID=1377 RepID=A0ABN0ABB1_AERVM|nr:putative addiction module antidote [Aerococcus viridans ATCC 11563 = CCUG 4311]
MYEVINMKMIQRSTRKSGHSVITTLPPDVLQQLNLNVGDPIEYVIKGGRVEIRKAAEKEDDFLATVNAVMDDYTVALEGLVSR